MNIKKILEAWAISFSPTPKQQEQAERRCEICEDCPSNKTIIIPMCTECGCPIAKKIFTPKFNPCPLKKWEEVDIQYIPGKKITSLI